MAGEAGRVHAGGGDALLKGQRHGLPRQPHGSQAAVPVFRPEDGTAFDPCNVKTEPSFLDAPADQELPLSALVVQIQQLIAFADRPCRTQRLASTMPIRPPCQGNRMN